MNVNETWRAASNEILRLSVKLVLHSQDLPNTEGQHAATRYESKNDVSSMEQYLFT